MLYKVFIDDSGDRKYKNPYALEFIKNPPSFKDYSQFWRDNYFVLCAIRIHQKELGVINNSINQLKEMYFNTKSVEIKSDWLRNPNQQKKHYLLKYGIKEEQLREFVNKIYELIQKYDDRLKMIAVVFDKRFFGDDKRKIADGLPLLKCTQVLFERLQYTNKYHIVVFDQFESHLKIGRGDHKRISEIAQGNSGLEKVFVSSFDKIIDIKFSKSSNENFIQLADLCAYNVYRQFIEYGRQWHREKGEEMMSLYEYFDKIRYNFMSHPKTNRVSGCGLICIPDIAKCNWNLLQKNEGEK